MNHCMMQQSAFATRDEIRSSVLAPISDRRDPVVCPKPRRFVQFTDHTFRSPRRLFSQQAEVCDSKAGTDLLDIFLTKGGYGMEQSSCAQVASSPPFFCGSPPSRVANPVIQDARFGDEMFSPFSPATPIPPRSDSTVSPTPTSRKVGFVRSNFAGNPAVRVEGFDCLDRDSRSCSIPSWHRKNPLTDSSSSSKQISTYS